MSDFYLVVKSSLESGAKPLAEMGLSSDVTTLRYTTNANGYGDLDVGMDGGIPYPVVGYLPQPINLPLRAHVEIWYGSVRTYQGRVIRRQRGPGGLFTGFAAQGYWSALNDGWLNSSSTVDITSGDALIAALAAAATYIRVGNDEQFIDPGIVHVDGLSEWRYMTPGEMANQIAQEGNSDGQPVDIGVWDGPRLWCLPRVAPDVPTYRIGFDPSVVSWEDDCSRMASHIVVQYGNNNDLTSEAETADFYDRNGFTSRMFIPAGDIRLAAATAFRNSELTVRAQPDVTAMLSLVDGEGLRLLSGAEQPPELVRSLEWVQVGDEPLQPIVGTVFDATAKTLSVELGNPSPYLPRNANIREMTAVAQLMRGIDPVSGGRRS